jgi:hypothetical protein
MGTVAFGMNFCMVHNRDSKMPLVHTLQNSTKPICIHPKKTVSRNYWLNEQTKIYAHGQDLRLTQ